MHTKKMFRIDFWLQSILLSILVLVECLAVFNTESAFLFVFLFLFLVGLTQFISCLYNAMVRQIFFFKKYLSYIGLYFGLLVLVFWLAIFNSTTNTVVFLVVLPTFMALFYYLKIRKFRRGHLRIPFGLIDGNEDILDDGLMGVDAIN